MQNRKQKINDKLRMLSKYLLFDKDEIVQRLFLLHFLILDFLHQILDVLVVLGLGRDQQFVIFAKFIKVAPERRDQWIEF